VESASDPALDLIESTGPGEQLTVERNRRHSDFPAIWHVQDSTAAQDEILAGPAEPPPVQLDRHQETLTGLSLVILEELEHAENLRCL
jgi:hypothetical protein